MQKIWRQIGLTPSDFDFIHGMMLEDNLKNETEAVHTIIQQLKNFRTIVGKLQSKLYEIEQEKKIIKGDSEHE